MSKNNNYALVLGSSSGFGKATAIELAKNGYNIYGVHLDRGSAKKAAEELVSELKSYGVDAKFWNVNAASDEKRAEIIEEIKTLHETNPANNLRVIIHSLAFGTLKSFIHEDANDMLSRKQIEMTMDVMANSLIYWTQDLHNAKLLANNSRIIAFSSIGATRQMHKYGAVSAAKAALESYIRQLSVELAPYGTTSNAIFAGLTETAAASKIPGYDKMIKFGKMQSPFGRLTTPEDIAYVVNMLCDEKCNWITGETLRVDGGDAIYEFFEYDGE
ncbi:SDR family oxidoreductase [Candidatus Kapabacteria bacterium]|nr:SDR family oxidoreductase [Candidatus Kapabacteria bacterium]